MQDGKIMIAKERLHYRASFWWQGRKFTSNSWGTREQAETQAQQMIRTLSDGPPCRALNATPRTTPLLVQGSVQAMSRDLLRRLGVAHHIKGASRMNRDELIRLLTPILEG